MPDTHSPNPTAPLASDRAPDWHETLRHGDIVLFAFPVADTGSREWPKPRPCLVLDVHELPGARYALLAFGTSAMTDANRGYEIRVRRTEEARACGLHKPTRFVGARRLLVPLSHPGFGGGRLGTPVIGRLTGALFERMNAVRARIHAEADIAAERRAERRREILVHRRRAGRRVTRPVIVETRVARR